MRTLTVFLLAAGALSAADWPTFGGDPQRSGWARGDTSVSTSNVDEFQLLWKRTVENTPLSLTALTAPIVADGKVIVAGSADVVYALDLATGDVAWETKFKKEAQPTSDGFWLCPKGLNATPTADAANGLVYVLTADGRLHALNLSDGKDRYRAIQITQPYAKAWSLTRIGDRIYTSISQNCGDTPSGVVMVDVSDPVNYKIRNWRSAKYAAGIWGRGGALVGHDGRVYGATGDGDWNPGENNYGQSIVALHPETLALVDYFTPTNWDYVRKRDFDIGTSPVAFEYGDSEYVAVGGKEGLIYLVETAAAGLQRMGGPDHHENVYTTPLVSNEEEWFEAKGVWGGLSTYESTTGQRYVYAPIWGETTSRISFPKTNGDAPDGSIAAFTVERNEDGRPWLKPVWRSNNLAVPEPVVIANGVVFALSNGENARQTRKAGIFSRETFQRSDLLEDSERVESDNRAQLFALDAETGETLWHSDPEAFNTWTHFSGISLSDGKVCAVDFSSTVYCFGRP